MSIAALLFFIRRLGLTLPLWLVAGWSAAEAALFFIVADVPISWIAVRRGPKAAALAAVVAAVASVIGGIAAYWWAGHDPAGQTALYAVLPGIDPALVAEAADRFHKGMHAVLAGSFGGIPFKLFAAEAGRSHQWVVLALAPLLRLPRFLLVGVGVGLVSNFLARWLSERSRLGILVAAWSTFYAWYWWAMA
jgi:membrane protein YqaA with SNARE-associated domain